jgi:PRTRC genetic system protein E
MFQQLVPLLRQRSVLLTVTALEEDQICVNVLPKKLADGENAALTTPMRFTGTAAELDAQLPEAIVSFVASHLGLKKRLTAPKRKWLPRRRRRMMGENQVEDGEEGCSGCRANEEGRAEGGRAAKGAQPFRCVRSRQREPRSSFRFG